MVGKFQKTPKKGSQIRNSCKKLSSSHPRNGTATSPMATTEHRL
jgi:hypothetical protein